MKKYLVLTTVLVFGLSTLVYAQSFSTVLNWMNSNGLTKYDNVTDYRPDDLITRGEISKLFANYAELQGLEKTRTATECSFGDIADYDYTLKPTIIEACEYGLVKGSKGNYMPNNLMTEAEALTVTIRSVMGMQNEAGTPRWREYYEMGKWLDIIDNEGVYDLDTPITRKKAGLRLYRASQVEEDEVQSEGTEELEEIIKDIFGDDFFD